MTNLVFDFGAVLFNWKPITLIAQTFELDATNPHAASQLAHAVFAHPDWHSFDRGGLSMEEVHSRTVTRLGLDAARLQALLQHLGGHLAPMAESIEVLRRLHAQRAHRPDIKLYYLSNMPVPYARRLEELHSFLTWFDGGIFSGDVQCIKPEPEIYQLLQTRYALDPAQTVFIDDLHANVHAAQRQGWRGIHFQSAQQLQAELAALGW
jgi:putative hydrolase of the HAD superfamily